MSRSPERRVFPFSWGKLGRGLSETIFSTKTLPGILDMKYRSEFKHGFMNRRCLHSAILKV